MADDTGTAFYPENVSPFRAQLTDVDPRFAELREAVLLDYGSRTAAAYWGDLESLREWCLQEGVNLLCPAKKDIKRYLDELRAAHYSPNTIARRLTAFRRFYAHLVDQGVLKQSPVADTSAARGEEEKSERG